MNYRAFVSLLRRTDPSVALINTEDTEVTGVTCDSRLVEPGFIFAALPGLKADGTAFIDEAIARGASAIISSKRIERSLPVILTSTPRRTMALTAAILNGEPTRRLNVMGVTGTNGKTTSAFMMRHILEHAEQRCGLIGTVECVVGARSFPSDMTTPEAPQIQAWAAEMLANGQTALAMEVSSIALKQERATGIDFDVAVFTQLTQDHLDFHGTMEEYFEAKALLFTGLRHDATAVINLDCPWGRKLLDRTHANVITVGFAKDAELRAAELSLGVDGMEFDLYLRENLVARVSSPLTGRYNASNILGVIGAALALRIDLSTIVEAIASFCGAPGRLERVFAPHAAKAAPAVFVDYAHTPDAIENVCSTLRAVCDGRKLVTVFGCGGDRDKTKRPKMGHIALRLSEHVVVTSDNPRTENPDAIIKDILVGMVPTNQATSANTYEVEPDRAAAIRIAMRRAGPNGVVLIAGKGHEDYQIIGKTKHHFDDREQARDALAELVESARR